MIYDRYILNVGVSASSSALLISITRLFILPSHVGTTGLVNLLLVLLVTFSELRTLMHYNICYSVTIFTGTHFFRSSVHN